jgi:hypothetical protein
LLNSAFQTASAVVSDQRALRIFRTESATLNRLVTDDESYDVFAPYSIPRVFGIEDASRNWSVAMVLQHLCLVNHEILVAVESLSRGVVPKGEIELAFYKPDADVDDSVFTRFDELNQNYVARVERILESNRRLPTHPTFPHPWFGALNAHQWNLLAAVHQKIHRRQAQKIIAMLGVT